MKHAHQTQFGRPVSAVQTKRDETSANNDAGMVDKWDILTALTDAADAYDLNHRSLGVLKALLSFLPERMVTPAPQSAIVFPSNRTLARRLNDMPDSTLRRHLAALVSAGVVSRHDSANRKRFARGVGQKRQVAFGLDLSPLARRAGEIVRHAEAANKKRQRLGVLRAQVAQARQEVLAQAGPSSLTDLAARILRRIPDAQDLGEVLAQLEAQITLHAAEKASGTDAQNERHIQYESKILPDSEEAAAPTDCDSRTPKVKGDQPSPVSFEEVVGICAEYKSYFPEPVRHWHDLAGIADRLTPMMGIEPLVFKDAIRKMGLQAAVTVVLCILERLGDIRNPGGYLRRLTQSAQTGGFSVRPILHALTAKQSCQLTIG